MALLTVSVLTIAMPTVALLTIPCYFMPPGARPAQGKRGGTGRLVYLRAGKYCQ